MNVVSNKVYLFVHVIWYVNGLEPQLSKSIRKVLFAYLQKHAEENGTRVIKLNGVEDHVHVLLQLLPAQNLAQVVKNLKSSSQVWLNETKLAGNEFRWSDEFAAYSVSPSGVKAVADYIEKQEEHHQTRTLEDELKIFQEYQF